MKHLSNTTGIDKIIFYLIGGFTLLALVLIVVFSISESKQAQGASQISSYIAANQEKPKAETSGSFSDLGTMKVSDEKRAEFRIENKGNKPLQLYQINTSCDCTFGQITIDGNKSPEFSMHSKNAWVGSIDPGKVGILTVIYRPSVMPVKGVVTRDVYVQTNDPQSEQLTFSIKAFVE